MTTLKLLLLLALLGLQAPAFAKLVHIIHTNDLHSFFGGSRSGLGGYARIKTLVDQLRKEAEEKGIPTLFLDGGDFGEGSSFYFSNEGVDAIRGLDLLGVDVSVLGNHDYFLGGDELSRQLVEAKFQGHMLSANLRGKNLMSLRGKVKDYVDYDISGMKIRIMGLSTPEIHFQYPLVPKNIITSAHKTGIRQGQKAQRDGVDLLIALTHIGLEKDIKLATHSRSIDLIIGGHSHTRLERPTIATNLRGNEVPIFQTGAHGIAVGSILIDVLGDSDVKLIDYKLIDVTNALPEDQNVKDFVAQAYGQREKYFNRKWDEVIGFTTIPLTGLYQGKTRNAKSCWSRHIARMTREVADADLGFQFDLFQGEEIPAGPIRFGDIIDNFPHFRQWGDKGWNVHRARVTGLVLKQFLKAFNNPAEPLDTTVDGIYELKDDKYTPFQLGGANLENLLIDGEQIRDFQTYTVAIPSEIPAALGLLGPIRDILFRDLEAVEGSNYWEMVEDYIRENSPLTCF